jgi:hypothetical protein
MAKGIYCLKMLLFSDQIKITQKEKRALEEICCFIVKWIYMVNIQISALELINVPIIDIRYIFEKTCSI